MAAVIPLRTVPALDDHRGAPHHGARPPLRVIHGGRSAVARRRRRTFLARRALVLAGLVVVVWLLAQMVGAALAPSTTSSSPQVSSPAAVHRVEPGDTLWALATSIDPQADPRDVVERIVQMNLVGVPGAPLGPELQLRVGAELRLPVAS